MSSNDKPLMGCVILGIHPSHPFVLYFTSYGIILLTYPPEAQETKFAYICIYSPPVTLRPCVARLVRVYREHYPQLTGLLVVHGPSIVKSSH